MELQSNIGRINYEKSKINFDSIVDYFIEKKDGYYIAELISAIRSNGN